MKRLTRFLLIISLFALGGMLFANTPPTVTNVSASQRTDGSRIVDIWYSVNDADNDTLIVSVEVSNDNGATFGITPSPANISGAIGENILSGSNKHIVWNAGNEGIAFNGSQFRVKVTATEKINLSFGLVAYYPFNGNANDESGNGHHGVNLGPELTIDRFGRVNNAYHFDGLDDYIDIGSWVYGGRITFSLWIKKEISRNNFERFIDLSNGTSLDNYTDYIILGSTDVPYECFFGLGYPYEIRAYDYIQYNEWIHVVASVDANGTMKLYKNGQLFQQNVGFIPSILSRQNQFLGKCLLPVDRYYKGSLDDIRFYNRSLTENEIQALYHEGGWPVIHPIEMVDVQGGSFQMGEVGIAEPVHTVNVGSFQMAKSEITQAQWQEVMGNNPSYLPGYPNRPVEQVTWLDCISFCNALSVKEGLNPCYSWNGEVFNCDFQANGYRLPTEAEWEFAARGGTLSLGYTYSGSNDVNSVAWYEANSDGHSHDVMTKPPNELNLYDMSGNVWEWSWDYYSAYVSGSQTNPTGAPLSAIKTRRGGSWHYVPGDCMCSFRWPINQVDSFNWLGFRICRSNR